MKRRSYRQIKHQQDLAHHHHVYVVLLDEVVGTFHNVQSENPDRDPDKCCLYVGMTGLNPEERFRNHKKGIKSARIVRDYGVELLPDFYEHLNPMPYEAALQMEADLAEDLRRQGYTVAGGH